MSVDTLTLAQQLRAAELPAAQAEAIAAAIGRGSAENMESAATKADLALVRADLAQLESRLDAKLEALNVKLLTWFVSAQVAIGALIVAALKL